LASSINVWAGDWRDSGSGASIEFTVPGQYRQVGWGVTLPQGWSATQTEGETSVGSSINVVASSPACFRSVDPRTPVPAPTEPPRNWCPGASHGPRGSHIALSVTGARSQTFGNTKGFDPHHPPLDPWSVEAPVVPPSVPLTAHFNFGTLRSADFEADHFGRADVQLRITDVTTGQHRLLVDTTDDQAFGDGYGLRLENPAVEDVSFGGNFLFWKWSGGTWMFPSKVPQAGAFIRSTGGVWQATFVPEQGHRYLIASMAAHDACLPDFAMWSVAVVQAECPSGAVCPTPVPAPSDAPLPTPLPTPLPPPQPPAAQGDVKLLMHSRHDPQHGGASAHDAVYRSAGTTVAWPQGEILDFAPAVTLAPLPPTPVDPFYGRRYSFRQQIVGWSFVTAAPCRGSGKPSDKLQGCAYAYLPHPSEAQIATQARAVWAGGNPAPVPADVYATTMSGLDPVELPVAVLVETQTLDANGNVVLRRSTTLAATFRVELVAPRSVR